MSTEMRESIVGKPIDRVDGRLKVTGTARYAAEAIPANVAHAVLVQSTIAKGRIQQIDPTAAETAPGVLAVITHLNAPRLNPYDDRGLVRIKPGEKLVPLQSDQVHYDGQNIGIVVAETLEQARHAASLVRVTYDEEQPIVEIEQGLSQAYQPPTSWGEELQVQRGNVESAIAQSDVRLDATYTTPIEHHNPIEPGAATAVWNGDQLIIYVATQWIIGWWQIIADTLGMPESQVRILSPFVGGGFGCKGFMWWYPVLAAIAARKVGRPVKLVSTRQQMFTTCGYRPSTIQHLTLSATRNGQLTAIRHITNTETSAVDEFVEGSGLTTRMLYACPNLEVVHNLAQVNLSTPTFMRAPGESTCTFALESALDELANELGIDPVELRLINHADVNPQTGKPWSSKHLKDCYRMGAERFGWSRRNPAPGSMRHGDELIGWGVATATYPAYRSPASARVQLFADGRVIVSSATHDIGTGTYTVMTQVAAEALGLPINQVEFKLGDSTMPPAPVAGGSQSAASVGPAVQGAAQAVRRRVIELAIADPASPLHRATADMIQVENGRLFRQGMPASGETYAEILQRHQLPMVELEAAINTASAEAQEAGNPTVRICAGKDVNADMQQYAFQSFGAQFVEVRINPRLQRVRVTRVVSAIDVGRILNRKTARSQIMGGIIMGVGMALMEETVVDPQTGRLLVRNLADYHVPVQADIPEIEVLFTDKPDPHISPLGVRGVGEIGITGVAGAISNAVYHATGKRIRDLPVTPEKLL